MSIQNIVLADTVKLPRGGFLRVGGIRILVGIILLVAIVQIWLIFQKAINWDEFLHFGQIYALEEGRFGKSLQSLHVRLFGWTTLVSEDVVTQIQAARMLMLSCVWITAVGVTILARRLVNIETALLCGLVYLTAGFVFTNGFTYRPDPVAAAALMSALCLLGNRSHIWRRIIFAGILIGFAGAMTIKSIFYAPCFAALAILWWRDSEEINSAIVIRCGVVVGVALFTFAAIIGIHSAFLPSVEGPASYATRYMDIFLHFFEFEMIRYVFVEMLVAPLVSIGLVLLIPIARSLPVKSRILLIGLCGPLLCILFYRNTFPYFFTFLLPPICVAIAPVLCKLVERYGRFGVIALALFGPVLLLVKEPYGTLERQRATIAEVERLFPQPTPYLSYSSYVPHYPRQKLGLISGVSLDRYLNERSGQFAQDIENGQIAFVVATGDALNMVFNSDEAAQMLPDRDVQSLQKNFLRHSDTIYILGREICRQTKEQSLPVYRGGTYSIDGGELLINGQHVPDGGSISLEAGTYQVLNKLDGCVKFWALDHVPELPEDFPAGPIAGGY